MIRLCENPDCRASCDQDRACPFGCEDEKRSIVGMRQCHELMMDGSTPSAATNGYNSLENRLCVEYPDPES